MVRIMTVTSHIWRPTELYIGPLLFVIFINDMPSCVSPDTRIALFADDAKLYRTISSIDQVALQNDLKTGVKLWDIDFNGKKYVVLRVKTRKRHHVASVDYKLGNHNFLSVASQNDLGIMVTNNMNWEMHIK